MSRKDNSPLLHRVLRKVAPKIGATITTEPGWNIVGKITFKNGKHSYFKYSSLDLNPMAAAEIAKDKDYTNYFLKLHGYPIVPKSQAFYSDAWAAAIKAKNKTIDYAYQHAEKIGFPVLIKPNSGAQGIGVVIVENKKEFYTYSQEVFKNDRLMLVQEVLHGEDYRFVVLDGKVLSVYQRIPLNITGDGRSTIRQLIEKKAKQFKAVSRDLKLSAEDYRILLKLKHQKLTLEYVPAKREKVFLLDNANLSSGGDAIDVTETMPARFKKLAIAITKDMGLRFCGVDLIINNCHTKDAPYWVLEINGAPGLDHYSQLGDTQMKSVEKLYLDILKKLEKNF